MKKYVNILVTAFLLLAASISVYAQDTSEQEAKKARLEREIEIIDKQLAENASRSNAMLSTLTLIMALSLRLLSVLRRLYVSTPSRMSELSSVKMSLSYCPSMRL